jgi:hypothetical protein
VKIFTYILKQNEVKIFIYNTSIFIQGYTQTQNYPRNIWHATYSFPNMVRWTFPSLWVPELSLASATSFLQQQLSTTEPQ